jgi:hypothetical protein
MANLSPDSSSLYSSKRGIRHSSSKIAGVLHFILVRGLCLEISRLVYMKGSECEDVLDFGNWGLQ